MSTRNTALARPGFTLIEMIVVLGILALMAAVAVPAFRRLVEEDDLTQATGRVQALFQLARDSAIHGGQPVTVLIDSVSSNVWLNAKLPVSLTDSTATTAHGSMGVGRGFSLSASSMRMKSAGDTADAGSSLDLPVSVRLELSAARARFTFAPTGAAFADSLVLKGAAGTRLITLDPWTGDVVVR